MDDGASTEARAVTLKRQDEGREGKREGRRNNVLLGGAGASSRERAGRREGKYGKRVRVNAARGWLFVMWMSADQSWCRGP